MRGGKTWAARIVLVLAAVVGLCAIPSGALAVHTEGLFELDRDAVDNPLVPGDDWSNVYLGLGGFFSRSFVPQSVEGQGVDQTFFTGGGSKDVNDINEWAWTTLDQTPDKDQIQNSYAAAYTKNGDTYAYFGMDRFATSGTADIGFWFFQSPISLNPDGTFSGTHTVGDVLVLSEFTNGGTVSTITVYRWVGGADPLELVASGVDCSTTAAGDDVCAVVNDGPIVSPWPYTSKDGAPNIIPANAFFEGGINLSVLFGTEDVPCFSSFLAETRSSSSLDARLKDFAFGSINTCGSITVHKETSPANVDQNFGYTTSGTGLSSFTLNAGAAGTATKVFSQLHPGSFSITEDALPAGWQFSNVTCTADNGSSFQIDSATRRVDITLGNVGQVDCTYSNLQEHPELSIVKTATEQSFDEVGDVVHYTITATNTGNVTLPNVTVTDPNVSNLVCSPVAGSSLAPGAAMTCTATHTITQADLDAGHYANTACVNATGAAQKCDDEDVPGVKTPALSLVKTASPTTYVAVGDTITYSYVVRNTGNVRLAGPATVADDKATVTCPNVNTVGNNDAFLDPGEQVTCTATYTIKQSDLNNGSVTNTATATVGGTQSNEDKATVTAVQNPTLTLTKSATPATYSSLGQAVAYTYVVRNTGNVRLAGPVTVTDNKTAVTCPNVNTVGNNDAFLDPGEQVVCTAVYLITQADLNAGSVTNIATATVAGTQSNQATATVTALIPQAVVIAPPPPPPPPAPRIDLAVTKTDLPDPASIGGRLTYTLTVRNNGPDTATGVVLDDPLPASATFVSIASSAGTCTGGTIIHCALGTMRLNDSVTITVVVRPTTAGTLINTATVVGNEAETNTANNTATATTVVPGLFKPPAVKHGCYAITIATRSTTVGKPTNLTIRVTELGKPVAGARVRVTGAGVDRVSLKSDKRGMIRMNIVPRKAGIIRVTAVAHTGCGAPRVGVVGAFTPPVTG